MSGNNWHFSKRDDVYNTHRRGEDGEIIVGHDWSVTATDDIGNRWGFPCDSEADADAKLASIPEDFVPSDEEDGWYEDEPCYGSEAWDDEAEWRLALSEPSDWFSPFHKPY